MFLPCTQAFTDHDTYEVLHPLSLSKSVANTQLCPQIPDQPYVMSPYVQAIHDDQQLGEGGKKDSQRYMQIINSSHFLSIHSVLRVILGLS